MTQSDLNTSNNYKEKNPWPLRRRAVGSLPIIQSSRRNDADENSSCKENHGPRRDRSSSLLSKNLKCKKARLAIIVIFCFIMYQRFAKRQPRISINGVPLPQATSWPSIPAPLAEEVLDIENLESRWNSKGDIPPNLWFTYKIDILKSKKPPQYFQNVGNSIDKYAEGFLKRNITNIHATCMDDEYCEMLIDHVSPMLTKFFKLELNGSFKGDICRIAALYKFGGYYMDVDMEVIEPYMPQNVYFTTSWDMQKRSFFQSFTASTPGHPIIKSALDLMLEYYRGFHPEWNNTIIMGPVTLEESYRRHTGDFKTTVARDNSMKGLDYSKEYQLEVARTIKFLRETNLKESAFPSLTRRTTGAGDLCNIVVYDPNSKLAYFWSRIVGSSNCPYQKIGERFRRLFPHGTCGGGHVGNGLCYHSYDCCSKFGYCGTKTEYCSDKNRAKSSPYGILFNPRQSFPIMYQHFLDWMGYPTCGSGNVGNGRCADPNACCSKYGWCGSGTQFCNNKVKEKTKHQDNTIPKHDAASFIENMESRQKHLKSVYCGHGRVGNGRCEDPSSCCSKYGWCGVGDQFCKTAKPDPDVDKTEKLDSIAENNVKSDA